MTSLSKRDAEFQDDLGGVFIDTFGDPQNA